jgi:uncharacterized protein YxjI
MFMLQSLRAQMKIFEIFPQKRIIFQFKLHTIFVQDRIELERMGCRKKAKTKQDFFSPLRDKWKFIADEAFWQKGNVNFFPTYILMKQSEENIFFSFSGIYAAKKTSESSKCE